MFSKKRHLSDTHVPYTVSGIMWVKEPSSGPGDSSEVHTHGWMVSFLLFTMLFNVIVTVAIVARLQQSHLRLIAILGQNHGLRQYTDSVALFSESSALFTVFTLALGVAYATSPRTFAAMARTGSHIHVSRYAF